MNKYMTTDLGVCYFLNLFFLGGAKKCKGVTFWAGVGVRRGQAAAGIFLAFVQIRSGSWSGQMD